MKTEERYSVVIVEDEVHSRSFIRRVIGESMPKINVVGEAETVSDAIRIINETNPDVVLFDIQLKDGISFNIFNAVDSSTFQSIFITSYDNYAIKAIKLSAIDYIIKPIHIPELISALNRAIENQVNNKQRKFDQLTATHSEAIVIPHNGAYNHILFSDIYALVSEESYTRIHLADHSILSSKPLSYYEDIFPDIFFRCHRSTIVNCNKIKTVDTGRGGTCTLSSGLRIDVSVRKKPELMHRISH